MPYVTDVTVPFYLALCPRLCNRNYVKFLADDDIYLQLELHNFPINNQFVTNITIVAFFTYFVILYVLVLLHALLLTMESKVVLLFTRNHVNV